MMATTGYRAVVVILVVFAASSESCDERNTIHDENELIWERIWSTHPTPGTESLVDGINVFFDTLRLGAYDLVVLIERSEKLERGEFYLRQRRLVEDIIRYHVEITNWVTHVTFITFGHKDSAIIMSGLRNKDTFFQTTWPTVIYEPDEADGNVDIRLAFDLARDAFESFLINTPRLLLLLSSGEFTDRPSEITLTYLNDTNVKIYVVHCGTTSEETIERLQELASEPGFCEPFEKWVNASWVNTPRFDVTPDATCEPHGWGYVNHRYYPACRCAWGYTGDKCNVDEDECDFDMCGANEACWDGIASFVCACLNSTLCGCYCEKTCMEPDDGDGLPGWVAPVIVLLLAVIILIVLVALVLRHQKITQHPSNASVAPPQRNIRWFVQQFVVIATTGCRHDSAGDTDSEVGEGYQYIGAAGTDDGTVNTLSEAGGPRVKTFNSSVFSRPPRPLAVKPSPKTVIPTTVSNQPLPPTPMTESGNKPSEKEPKTNIEDRKVAAKKLGNNEYPKPASPGNKGRLSQPDYLNVFPDHQMEPKSPVVARTKSDAALNRKGVSDVSEVKDDVPSTTDPDDIPYDETEGIYVPRPPDSLPELEDGEAQHISIEQQKGYKKALKCCDMEPWSGYLLQVLYSGRLEYVYISSNDQEQYISSGNNSNFLLTHEEYVLLQSNLTDATGGLCFKFKDRYFVMREAEQTHFVAVHDGAKEVLCVAKNDRFLVVGKRPSVSERSKIICRQNVQYICEHLV